MEEGDQGSTHSNTKKIYDTLSHEAGLLLHEPELTLVSTLNCFTEFQLWVELSQRLLPGIDLPAFKNLVAKTQKDKGVDFLCITSNSEWPSTKPLDFETFSLWEQQWVDYWNAESKHSVPDQYIF